MEKVTSNKKMIIAGIIAALCLAVVAGFASMAINNADATDSPVAPVTQNGFTATVSGVLPTGQVVELGTTTVQASNVPAGVTALANFQASNPNVTQFIMTVSYENAAAVAGQAATLYVQHDAKDPCSVQGTFDNSGVVSFTVDGCSIFSVVTTLNENTGNTSPKTGIYS